MTYSRDLQPFSFHGPLAVVLLVGRERMALHAQLKSCTCANEASYAHLQLHGLQPGGWEPLTYKEGFES